MRLPLLISFLLLCSTPVLFAEDDIIEQVKTRPSRGEMVEQADGKMKEAKYGDSHLEQAEVFLSSRYARPWTTSKVVGWLQAATDDPTKIHLLRLLAASREPKAALIVGGYLETPVGMDAAEALNDYFTGGSDGGSRSQFAAATKWFATNKERLQHGAP